MSVSRYVDSGKVLGEFRDKIFVKCPKCGNGALVKGTGNWPIRPGSLVCIYCSYSERTSSDRWKGPIITYINRRCGHCGFWNQYFDEKPYFSHRYKKDADIKCGLCGRTNFVKINWWPKREPETEPYFGLPLFFSIRVGKNILWVYNLQHLEELQLFVSSKVRERNAEVTYTTMVEKLPKWLIGYKGRPAIIKALERLKEKVISVYEDYGFTSPSFDTRKRQ